ncbi:TIGR02757 family protein [Duncaniella dubosii]|uniref:TIGR02757 family protein n=1 Tax=Duncaniella dubosii TaxID=2518971 RepID=A0A4P7W009_9BACT|nr:TIGR02757 family protein [Duncaniella dubosii]QCD41143.1 TIGR02757 family protein [Duncaniella dubosii]
MTEIDLKNLLDTEAARINSPSFIEDDPVQFPRRFEDIRDIEIAALLTSGIAWGNRKMICRNCDRLLALMDNKPYAYVMDEGYEDLPDGQNIHRTFFTQHLKHYLRGLRVIYLRHGSLQEFGRSEGIAASEAPAWRLVEGINRVLEGTDPANNEFASRCLPQNLSTTALKRVNMALRWLVRNDGIVDMGVWDVINPSQLYIPLDVHVGDISRELGLLTRKANDRRSVDEVTAHLRRFTPPTRQFTTSPFSESA